MGSRWALWLVIASASCGVDYPFVGFISKSLFFEYHDQVDEPLCPTLLSSLDRHAQMIGGKVGLVPDANDKYQYFKFRDLAAFKADSGGCLPDNGACALGDAIFSDTYFHAHEQAHDYVFRAWGGWSDGLLNEGEAVALSCNPFYELDPGQKPVDVLGPLDWRNLLHLYGDSNQGYGAAGFFVTHLADQYGWQSVFALHGKVSSGASADDVAQAFAEVYPISIDQAWSEALGTAGARPCQKDWRCITTPIAVREVAVPDCDGEMHRSVDVATGGAVLSMVGANAELMLLRCDLPAPTSYTLEMGRAGQPSTHWASLPTGSYAMLSSGELSSVTLQSYFQGPLVGDSCDSAGAVSLDPAGHTSIDLLAGRVDGWMRLAGGGHTYDVSPYNLIWNDLLTTQAISICDDCSAVSCVAVPFGQVTRVVVGDQSVVRFQAVISAPPTWGQLLIDPVP